MALILNGSVLLLLIIYSLYILIPTVKKVPSLKIKLFLVLVTSIHFSASILFACFLEDFTSINDPTNFYENALETTQWFSLFNMGSSFISFLIFPFVKLGLTIEVLFLVFATISFKGLLLYFELIGIDNLSEKNNLLLLFYLTPSFHFWTSFLGKEALLLWLMVLVLKKIKFKKYDWKFALIGGIIFMIRPHVFLILLLGLGILFLMDETKSKKVKRNWILITMVSFLVMLPVFMKFFLKIDTLNSASIQAYITDFISTTSNRGTTAISLTETTIFTRIGYLLVMPLPFLYEIKNSLQLIVSIENIYFVLVILGSVYYVVKQKMKWSRLTNELRFALISGVLLMILFASYLYNLGLGNRMRIMFFPYLFYFLISTVDYSLKFKKHG